MFTRSAAAALGAAGLVLLSALGLSGCGGVVDPSSNRISLFSGTIDVETFEINYPMSEELRMYMSKVLSAFEQYAKMSHHLAFEGLMSTLKLDDADRVADILAAHLMVATAEKQSLLELVNPYERHLTFLDDRTRTRRDHLKYLTLIDAIALVHQHQRGLRRSARYGQEKLYIEVELLDIELGTELAHEVLGRSLDELSPQTRRFLSLLDQMAAAACERQGIERPEWRFSQREVREHTGWSDFAVKTHLRKLVELEYVLVHRSQRGQSFVYELLYRGEGTDGRPFVLGLIDVEKLRLELETPSRSDEATAASTTEPIQLEPERRDYDPDREHPEPERVQEEAKREAPGSIEGATKEHGESVKHPTDDNGAEGQKTPRRGKTQYKGKKATRAEVASSAVAIRRNGSGRKRAKVGQP